MRLKSILRYQQERDQRNADPNLQMMGSSVREEEVEDTERLRGGRQGSHDYLTPVQGMKVCRHADRWVPDWLNDMNVLLEDSGDDQRLRHDIPLSPLGLRQAHELGSFLATQDVSVIISSPYLRCIQTAEAVSIATGARICLEPGLSEGPGHEPGWLPTKLERKRYFPQIDLSYRPLAFEPAGEETDRDVIPRAVKMSRALSAWMEQQGMRGQVIVVTHASVMLGLVAAAAAGVGERGGYNADVTAEDLDAVDALLQDMDGARPAGSFTLERPRRPLTEYNMDESEETEEEGEEQEMLSLWRSWHSDLSCTSHHLSREACEDGTGTPVYRLPLKPPSLPDSES